MYVQEIFFLFTQKYIYMYTYMHLHTFVQYTSKRMHLECCGCDMSEWTCGVSLPSHSRHDVWYDTWCFPYEQTKLFLHLLSAPVLIINQSPPHKNASVLTRADNSCPVNDTCTSAGWGLHRSLFLTLPPTGHRFLCWEAGGRWLSRDSWIVAVVLLW